MTAPAFYLTRHAALTLCDIHAGSVKQWGDATADRYMAELYAAIGKAAKSPAPSALKEKIDQTLF